eukprot:6486310-Amphidinium_carterae.1
MRRVTRVHLKIIINGDRLVPPGPESNDPQANIALADDFVELMEMFENEEDAIRAFLELPSDNVIKEGVREGFIDYIGTSARLFVKCVYDWRAIHDLSAADFKEYKAATASAFPPAMSAEDHKSKEDLACSEIKASSKTSDKAALSKPTSDKREHRDHGGDGSPPEDTWAKWREKHGMDSVPPKKQDTPKKPKKSEEPDGQGSHDGGGDDGRKEKKKIKKKKSPSPPSSGKESSSDDDSDSDDSS